MYYSLKGKIEFIDPKGLVALDVHDVSYLLYVSHIDEYKIGEEIKLFTYMVVREDEQFLIGFKSQEEKEVFLKLLSVKGLGPKTVIQALSGTTPDMVLKAIASNNLPYLKKLPGIGPKAAGQIILDLQGQVTGNKGDLTRYSEAEEALKALGFKKGAIENALLDINEEDASVDEIITLALAKLGKK